MPGDVGPQDAMIAPAFTAADEDFMGQALELAHAAEVQGEVPVGALLVLEDVIIGRGSNASIQACDPSAHAEIVALRAAAARVGNYRLPGTTMYVTLEPCAMCAGALLHTRVQRLVFGAADPRAGAAGSVLSLLDRPELNHRVAVEAGLLATASSDLLRAFFAARRVRGPERV